MAEVSSQYDQASDQSAGETLRLLQKESSGSPTRTYLEKPSKISSPAKRLYALRGYLSHHLIGMGSKTTLDGINSQYGPHSIHIHTFLALQKAVMDRCLQLFWTQVVQNKVIEWTYSLGNTGVRFLSEDLKDPMVLRKWLASDDSNEQIEGIKSLDIGMIPFLPPEIRYFTGIVALMIAPNLFGVWVNPPDSLGIEWQKLECLPPEVGDLKKLVNLSVLNGCLYQLPAEMKELKELRILKLSGNQFREFPRVLCEMEVSDLDLSRNPIDPKAIPKDWLACAEYV